MEGQGRKQRQRVLAGARQRGEGAQGDEAQRQEQQDRGPEARIVAAERDRLADMGKGIHEDQPDRDQPQPGPAPGPARCTSQSVAASTAQTPTMLMTKTSATVSTSRPWPMTAFDEAAEAVVVMFFVLVEQ